MVLERLAIEARYVRCLGELSRDGQPFRELLGSLMYVMLSVRPVVISIQLYISSSSSKQCQSRETFFEANRGCVRMAKILEGKRTKRIDSKHHLIRDLVLSGMLNIESTGTRHQLPDHFMKSLEAGLLQLITTN